MKVIYPGTFDPITKGHLDIIERSSKLFDEVVVVIMDNPKKLCMFNKEERLNMIENLITRYPNVSADIGTGLTAMFASRVGARGIIRGIRAVQDYEYELQTASANSLLQPDVETIFLLSKPDKSFLSSSAVKEIATYQGDISYFVDPYVEDKIKKKVKEDE